MYREMFREMKKEREMRNMESKEIRLPQVKPPLRVMPRKIHREKRILELMAAVGSYMEEGKLVPRQWNQELIDLLQEIT